MKKSILLFAVCVLLFAVCLYGCGTTGGGDAATTTTATTSTSTTSTTSGASATALKQQAASAALIVKGSSSIGTAIGAMGASGVVGASIFNVNAFSGASDMPDQFWTLNMVNTTEARIPVTFGGTMASIISGSMQFRLQNGNLLYGGRVASTEGQYHKIAKLGTYEAGTTEVYAIVDAGMGPTPAWMLAALNIFTAECQAAVAADPSHLPSTAYASSECFFQSISTIGEYIGWATILPSTFNLHYLSQSAVKITTPEATLAQNRLATIEAFLVFNAPITGEASFLIDTRTQEAGGCPKAGTYLDTATILTPAGTIEATVSMIFGSTTLSSIGLSGVVTPEGNTIYATMNSTGTSGTVILSSEAGVTLGTGEVSTAGVTWYPVGGSAEVITWSEI